MTEHMQAGKFKAECLKVMDRVKRTKKKIVITKRNKPVAQLVPIDEREATLFGAMKGTVHILGDIVAPIGREWDAVLVTCDEKILKYGEDRFISVHDPS